MRAFAVLIISIALVASAAAQSPRPRPPTPTSFTCSTTAANALASTLTNSINDALLPNASNAITTGGTKPYWKFTVPQFCWDNVLGFGLQGCTPGGTYEGSTGQTTTITGAFNMKVSVNLNQTSCSTTSGASGTWSMTATWAQIKTSTTVAIYPVTGGEIGVTLLMSVNNMVASASGNYAYTVNSTSSQMCVKTLEATKSSITVGSVSASANGVTLAKLEGDIESKITSKGSSVYKNINSKMVGKEGKCKTVNTPAPPRSPFPPRAAPPRPPRSAGRR